MFITGVLDELKICFCYTHWSDQGFMELLLCEESQLFEFRAKGGQVELSLQRNDLLIGMLLKSLEIEDLVAYDGMPGPRYLARSFIKSTDMDTLDSSLSRGHTRFESRTSSEVTQSEGDEKFFEASEDLTDDVDSMQPSENVPENSLIKPPSFSRMTGLLPDSDLNARAEDMGLADNLDSFVKAQIVIYDQSSPLYNNIDKQVMVTLATLSFYCYRPTILAIMEFVNAINVDDQSRNSVSNKSTAPVDLNDRNGEDSVDDQFSSPMPEPVIKSLLGKGKSRTIFYLTLSMARAQIFLKNENGTSFATLSQNNLLTDIKVFPSSFSIKADLGNLKISDDSLTSDHSYFWVCDMRNPGGNSFVELVFTSFSSVDEDYNGYDFSLFGRLSEVRIIYLNRFVQEVISYFMGLVPNDSKGVIKLKDQVTNSEKWFTTSEIEGSPAVKLDLSLRKPIIVMPRRTDSHDYLELDVVHITVQNNFQWLFGDKGEMNAIHMERLTVQIEDINLTVGTDIGTGESIIRDVRGLSVVIQRSLRDLLHQIPTMEVAIKIRELKAALSNREYQIITECALSNISETPKYVPLLNLHHLTSDKVAEPTDVQHEHRNSEAWITLAVSVSIDLVGLSLYSGVTRDTSLATVQASGAWLLYKSNSLDEGSLLATLQGFVVVDDREGTKDEYRLAIGKPETLGYGLLQGGWGHPAEHTSHMYTDKKILKYQDVNPITTMLILDAKLNQLSTSVSLCIQRPQLLVALDFLLALAEFFVPMVHGMLSNEMDENLLNIVDAIVLDQPTYSQPSSDFSLSPRRPLIADDERFGCFTYDGKGGNLYLQNSEGSYLCSPTAQAIIYVGNGKRLQFKNVHIRNGRFLDSSIMLGSNSSYSASKEDLVYLEGGDDLCQNSSEEGANSLSTPATATNRSTEFIIELQAIGPELTFYNKSKDFEESAVLSNKLLHVQLDILCRLVLMGETMEMSTNALGLTMESNGIKILEPFDASISFSSASGKTNIHVAASDIFMNFSFSILSLFLAVENDIMTFLNMSSKKATVVCSQFDKVGTVRSPHNDQTYAFWRPQAPPGFAVLGDYLTPTNKPPTKGVLAVNTNFARVKKPVSFKLIWSSLHAGSLNSNDQINDAAEENADSSMQDGGCSIWLPVAPQGYVALGCVVSFDRTEPPPSSALCISSSLVSPCELRDCVTISLSEQYASRLAFWRVNNSIGSFLPADPISLSLTGRPYELRHVIFGCLDRPSKASKSSDSQNVARGGNQTLQSGRSSMANSGRRFEAIASFKLVWWNQGSSSRKKLSIWRPLVPEGMVFFGDIAVQGYEPPNTCIVLHDSGDGDEAFFRSPLGFQLVGQIKKHRTVESISFWFPQAPPGFVSLGCIASKGTPKQDDVKSLRCIRSDMVTGDQFSEESIWDTSDVRFLREPFSIWKVGDEAETFLVRHGFRKPPKRFALKLADPNVSTGSDDTAIDAVVGSFSAALFDDYGGLMVPLFNISLDGIGFSLQGRTDCLNSTLNLSLAARSYNDKFESWEPLIEPVDGFLRYQYDKGAAVSASQLRITSTRDLNLNVSVSNTNMILQAYASWNSVSHVHETKKRREVSPNEEGKAVISIHHKKNSYIIMQNKLGLDIYLRANEMRGLAAVKMSHGDKETLKVPMSKNMLDADLKGNYNEKLRTMVTIIILDGQLPLPRVDGLLNQQYVVAVRLVPNEEISSGSLLQQQSARTCGSSADQSLPDKFELVNWNEMFFFKVDSPEYYRIEMIMTDLGKGEPVGFYSSPLKQIARTSGPNDFANELAWIELSSTTSQNIPQDEKQKRLCGKIRCAMFLSPLSAAENDSQTMSEDMKSGVIQISPARKGPWSTVKLSYAAPVACWRLGNDVIASEVSVKDGNRCVNIRSLVSITNSTDFILDLCLIPKSSLEDIKSASDRTKREEKENDHDIVMDELFETEKYNPVIGWVGCSCQLNQDYTEGAGFYEELSASELPSGWEWVDDWHVDSSTNTADGWVYAPDLEHLKWPESYNQLKFVNYARQRRWIRSRKQIPGTSKQKISVGLLDPGATTSLPLSGLRSPYVLQLRPWNDGGQNEYSWSSVVDNQEPFEAIGKPKEIPEICVSALSNSEELLHCSISESSASSSSDRRVHGLWFSLAIQSTEIGKDIHSDPIQDWNLVIKAPLSIANFLPLPAEFSVLEKQASGEFVSCSQGIFFPGKTVRIYADLGHPLYFSLIPQGGWLAIHKAVLLYHPSRATSKTISLRSLLSERTVQVILEQNQDKAQRLLARVVRVYVPYWIASARCPPLTCRLVEFASRRKASLPLSFPSRQRSEVLVEEITEAELLEGCTIDSILNFKLMGMSISIDKSSKKFYGPIQDLSPLGDMDGSVDLYAYDEDGKCMHLFISSKPCSFQSVPTKVISIRPFMTFTNRIGQDIFIKLNSEDEPKILCAFDSRVSFVYRKTEGSESSDKLQVRLEDTEWCIPVEITKEDTFSLVLRRNNCDRRFLRTEIRGNEEGSRFIVVFRLGSTDELIRIENRTVSKTISIRQSDLGDDAWIHLNPLSTINFSWEDPYGQRLIDARIHGENHLLLQKFDLTKPGWPTEETTPAVRFHVVEVGDLLVARFSEDGSSGSSTIEDNKVLASIGSWGTSGMSNKMQNNAVPIELIVELGIVGVSIIDQRPRELLYFYLEKVFISYSTGYSEGSTSRFKLILGNLQLDNQLPLTAMPVLLAPEQAADMHHPVFKMTVTMNNESVGGTQIYPYVYIRVTDKTWRLNIHEPIIWALVDFYNKLQLDRIPKSTNTSGIDPEIRVDLIDVSEVRLKLSLETEPTERPHGVLGVWSPVLSAVGNALKIQVHLRKVMRKNIFMRQSSVMPAIVNRFWRDLIHNPLHLIFSVDVLGMTSSTLASLSKGFAELSTDGQFLQLRSKQVWSRRITGVGDGVIQGTEALAQGVAFGVSGVVTKPVESARQYGLFGIAQGLGRAFLGFIVQPVSGALDFFSLTVDGIGASCSKCLEIFNNKATSQRIRNPRAIHADGVLREYCEREAIGQMVLYLAEASRHFGCTEIFKEPSKYAWSDHYEDHFMLPQQRFFLVTNKRVMLLQGMSLDKMEKKPSKIIWDVPWEELLALELAKAGYPKPSHLILHLKDFKKSEKFVRIIKCFVEEADEEPQAVRICSVVHKLWKAYQADMRLIELKVPSSQRHVYFTEEDMDRRDLYNRTKPIIIPRDFSSVSSTSEERRFMKHTINFQKIWSSEREPTGRCKLCRKQGHPDNYTGTDPMSLSLFLWYVSVGDIAHIGTHLPTFAALYHYTDRLFALPVGYDLVWRNCADDYVNPVSIWYPRAPDGFVSLGCVAVAGFKQPEYDSVYCVATSLAQDAVFEEQKVWAAPDSYPWACHIYQVQSEALHFIALRQQKEDSDWKPMRVVDDHHDCRTSERR
ncbi:hypothetical protein Scep_026427 [Stephania cephalantha]|uniref:Uncharacterized protein n=1 Tax=Stephania cephalantha TaxID=152367 RepID=A0AAP0ESE1_9MAGN